MTSTAYEVLLLDLDGTIVDYGHTEKAALGEIYRAFYAPRMGFEEFADAFHHANASLWSAYRRRRVDLERLRVERFVRIREMTSTSTPAAEVAAAFEESLSRQVVLFGDARPALRALRKDYRLVLVTDGIAQVQHRKLWRTRLRGFFERVVISSEVGYRKPDPALLRHALREVDGTQDSALVVGDSRVSDGVGAFRARIDFCWVNRTTEAVEATSDGVPTAYEVRDLRGLEQALAPARGVWTRRRAL